MKCPTCGGLIVSEPGICGEPDRLKCALCGRDPDKAKAISKPPLHEGDDDMASPEVKRDEKGKENGAVIPGHFRKYGYKKKKTHTKPATGERDYKAEYHRRTNKGTAVMPAKKNPENPGHPITTATPEEIIKALRKGVAAEMIQKIAREYNLRVTVESV